MDAEAVEGTDPLLLVPMSIGPFLVDLPDAWEVVDYPDERVTVIREPIDPEDPLLGIPGFVIPNVALRFFPSSAAEGGAASAAAREIAATFDQVPGAVLLAIAPGFSDAGLPGRAFVMTGTQSGIPFMSSRWHVGDGEWVLEITLTGPATPMPALVDLGQRIADSARPAGGTSTVTSPFVPEELRDQDMMAPLMVRSGAHPDGTEVPGLESVSRIHDVSTRSERVPGTILLDPEAWSSLVMLAQDGFRGRLAPGVLPAPHAGLIRAGLATDQGLTDAGRTLGGLCDHAPALTIRGRRMHQEWHGEVRLDGMDCLLTLDPGPQAGPVEGPPAPGGRLVGTALTIGLAGVLLDWCGLRADWFADLRASAPADRAGDLTTSTARPEGWSIESGGAVTAGILENASTHWSIALPDGPVQVSWIQPDHRGPLMVFGVDGGQRVQLVSTTGLDLHQTLSSLIRDVARSLIGTVES